MANLVIEIGNTALKAAWTDGATLGKTFRYQGEKTMDFILSITEKQKPVVMAVASARPVSAADEELLRGECLHLMILDSGHPDYLQRYNLPEHLSYDRASSIVAARYLFKGKPCIIFDFGTTLTVDLLDASGQFRGGNISPGCRTRFKSLNRYAKALPLVNTPQHVPQEGNSIETSIESGVISGIMFEIEGYCRLHPYNVIVFTGGDAIYFAKRMKNSVFVMSNLVLVGLALITDDYVEKNL
ncbi:MAG: type III pantothenate kinase [Bacteroidales bacterium]|jgi:type III pantothenate kinase|nr:type III pantothenate kinase [Bacteroidales bacterium]MBQ4201282.1 type III pantothenate kinase [Bacteroidales bacterium]